MVEGEYGGETIMREIKFRAWDKKRKKWIIHRLPQGAWLNGLAYDPTHKDNKNNPFVDTEISDWGQFTGLKDKEGVEVYEGSICKVKRTLGEIEFTGEIVWDNPEYGFMVKKEAYKDKEGKVVYQNWSIPSFESYEVIGNIYENPELIDQE